MRRLRLTSRPLLLAGSTILLLVLIATIAATAGSTGGKSPPPPRIIAAVLQDADGDFRADALRLTYSQSVRHALDRDHVYPFSVPGYVVRSVGSARGRLLVLALREKSNPDPAAKPPVRYRQTRSGPVTSSAGIQAIAQTFRATRAHGHIPPAPVLPVQTTTTATTTTVTTAADSDGDGTVDAQDCAPRDATIHPGAADLPDLAFVDSDCDGIDGQETKAVFASPLGKDTDPGTKAKPKRQIAAAVTAAATTGRYVLAAAGDYTGVTAVSRVGIFGGYDATSWKRSNASVTRITGSPQGLFADNANGVTIQLVSVFGVAGVSDRSVFGIRAINGASLTLQSVTVIASNALPGTAGVKGKAGAAGANGEPGHGGTGRGGGGCVSFLNSDGKRSQGGLGGISPVGRTGGNGGDGGAEGSNSGKTGGEGHFGVPGGAGGGGGTTGGAGKNGVDGGAPGAAGQIGEGGISSMAGALATWQGGVGAAGRFGGAGNGGGGGGGGGGRGGIFVFDMAGQGAGGGGGGGAPGAPGDGGGFGGGSFGIYLFNSTLTAESSAITAGDGGVGGRGGDGGAGGHGGAGGRGYGGTDAYYCSGYVGKGGDGGLGADGGVSGAGGGGAGGPSIGVMRVGSAATLNATTVKFGKPGPGGAPGAGGSPAAKPSQAGLAQAVYP